MISVIINFDKLDDFVIRETLNNVLNQTYKNVEILVNISFSKNDFMDIVKCNDISLDKISIFEEKDIDCIVDDLNGDFFILKRFEHKWMPDMLRMLIEKFDSEDIVDSIYSDFFFCDELENIIKSKNNKSKSVKPLYLIKKIKDEKFNLDSFLNTNAKKIEKKLYLNQVV